MTLTTNNWNICRLDWKFHIGLTFWSSGTPTETFVNSDSLTPSDLLMNIFFALPGRALLLREHSDVHDRGNLVPLLRHHRRGGLRDRRGLRACPSPHRALRPRGRVPLVVDDAEQARQERREQFLLRAHVPVPVPVPDHYFDHIRPPLADTGRVRGERRGFDDNGHLRPGAALFRVRRGSLRV